MLELSEDVPAVCCLEEEGDCKLCLRVTKRSDPFGRRESLQRLEGSTIVRADSGVDIGSEVRLLVPTVR